MQQALESVALQRTLELARLWVRQPENGQGDDSFHFKSATGGKK
jgi:hypothetical protein